MTDKRDSARKILKVRAVIALAGQAPMPGRTLDVSANGVSLTVADPMPVGQTGQVGFDLLVEGKLTRIAAHAKIIYCIFSSGEFKIGFQFLNLDMNTMTQLSRFLR